MRIFGMLAALCLGIFTAAGPNVAAPASPGSILNSGAISAAMASHNGVLTMAEANRLGIKPNTQYSNSPTARSLHLAPIKGSGAAKAAAAPAVLPSNVVSPMDASGCNDEVCISLVGSGLRVKSWITTGDTNGYECSYAGFWEDGGLIDTGPTLCNDGIVWSEALDIDFSGNTHVCNTWVGIGGKPCEYVHS